MKDLKKTLILILCLFMTCVGYTQVQADIEGDVRIRGNIDVHHKQDSTSVYIGRYAGIGHDYPSKRSNTFVGFEAGRSNISGYTNSFFWKRRRRK